MMLLELFFEFFKVGLFAIGGGLATIPFLTDMGLRTGWFSQASLIDMIAVSESTPGPMGVNMATYVGFETAGILGALIATLGLVTPSIIVIVLIAKVLEKFRTNKYVDAAFYGLRPASTGLIAAAGFSVVCIALLDLSYHVEGWDVKIAIDADIKLCLLAFFVFVLTKWKVTKNLHPVVFILISAVIGVAFGL